MSNALAVRQEKQEYALAFRDFDSLQKVADYLSRSQFIPAALRNKPADVAIVLAQGQELGLGPMQSLNGIEPIQGKATIKPELALALIRSQIPGAIIRIKASDAEATVYMARSKEDEQNGEGYEAHWDMKKAGAMGLAGKDNYKKQPGTMLRWRAVGEAARMVFPDLLKGLYIKGEIEREEREVESEVTDKVALLASKISRQRAEPRVQSPEHTAVRNPPEEEVVVVESEDGPQASDVRSVDQTDTGDIDPLADFVIPIGGHRGKRLRDLPKGDLVAYLANLRAYQKTEGKVFTGDWLLLVTRIGEYLGVESEDQSEFALMTDEGPLK